MRPRMRPEDLDFFKENGYLVLNQLLSDEETARFLDIFERERRDCARFWTNNPSGKPSTANRC